MKVFIAGSIDIKELSPEVKKKLDGIIKKEYEIIIGDAKGIDTFVQNYLYDKKYPNVKVYATNGEARNNVGSWEIVSVKYESTVKDRKYFTVKDEKMAEDSDVGLMIWNNSSQGTMRNILNLLLMNKSVCLFFLKNNNFVDCILNNCDEFSKLICEPYFDAKNSYETFIKKFQNKNQKNFISKNNENNLQQTKIF